MMVNLNHFGHLFLHTCLYIASIVSLEGGGKREKLYFHHVSLVFWLSVNDTESLWSSHG